MSKEMIGFLALKFEQVLMMPDAPPEWMTALSGVRSMLKQVAAKGKKPENHQMKSVLDSLAYAMGVPFSKTTYRVLIAGFPACQAVMHLDDLQMCFDWIEDAVTYLKKPAFEP